jgi:hypothetical protein
VLGYQRVQAADALQALRQPSPSQPVTILTLDLYIMVVLSPVVSYEHHLLKVSFRSDRHEHSTRKPLQPNDQVLSPKRARHPISSPVTGEPAGARSVNRPRIGARFREC